MSTPDVTGTEESTATQPDLTGSILWITFPETGKPVCSASLVAFLEEKSLPTGIIADSVREMPEGAWPVILGDELLLTSTVRFPDGSGIVFLREADRDGLRRFLDTCYSGDRMILTDTSGRILAASSSFESASGANSISEVLDPSSRMALQSALDDGVSGAPVNRFTGRELGTGRQYVLEPNILDCPGRPVLTRLSDPSVCIDRMDHESDTSFEQVFTDLPVPAVVLDERGDVIRTNSAAERFWKDTLERIPDAAPFSSLLAGAEPDEVNSVLERIKTEPRLLPVTISADLCSPDGKVSQCELTVIRLSDTGEVAVVVLPSSPSSITGEGAGQVPDSLLQMLENRPGDDDLFRWMLDLVRTGTGASGVSCRLEGRTITVGDVHLEDGGDLAASADGSDSTVESGSCTVDVQVRHRYGVLVLRLHGLASSELKPGQELVLKLAPVFIDYSYGIDSVNSVMKTYSSIRDFWSLLNEQNDGLEGMLKRIADISRSDSILLSTLREGESALVPVSGFGYSTDLPVLSLDADTVASWAYTHNEPTYMADSVRDSRFETIHPGAGSELAIPLQRDGRTVATLTASSRHRGGYQKPLPSLMSMMGTVISLWLFGGRSGADSSNGGSGSASAGMEKSRIDSLLLSLSQRLRSPLNALSANIRFLTDDSENHVPGQGDCLESMSRSVDDLASQCQRLLTFMRLELQDDTGESRWTSPAEQISSLLPRLTEKGRKREVSVLADLPEEKFLACYDPTFMEQIVMNLVENAIAYNRPDGEVRIILGIDGEVWTLEVADSGRGIDPSELPGIFDGFRSQRRSGDSGEGLGIGLAMVKHLTELQGGVISVWSNRDSGSRFILRFPLSG